MVDFFLSILYLDLVDGVLLGYLLMNNFKENFATILIGNI